MGWVKILPKSNPSRDHHVEVGSRSTAAFDSASGIRPSAASDPIPFSWPLIASCVASSSFAGARCGLPSVTQRVEVAPPLRAARAASGTFRTNPRSDRTIDQRLSGRIPGNSLVPFSVSAYSIRPQLESSVDAAAPSGRWYRFSPTCPVRLHRHRSVGPSRHQIPSRWTKSFLSSCAISAQTETRGTDPAAHTNTRSPRPEVDTAR